MVGTIGRHSFGRAEDYSGGSSSSVDGIDGWIGARESTPSSASPSLGDDNEEGGVGITIVVVLGDDTTMVGKERGRLLFPLLLLGRLATNAVAVERGAHQILLAG